MSEPGQRTRLTVMQDFWEETNRMMLERSNADALIAGAEKRQQLMDEFDSLPKDTLTEEEALQIKQLAKEVIEKDKVLRDSMQNARAELKKNLANANSQQKLLNNYMNRSLSSKGSYMDYSK